MPKIIKKELKLDQSRSIDRSSLIQIDKKYALMQISSQRQVTSRLENQLDYLLGKKERQALKKNKLKELQELYEKERQIRKSRIDFKITRSDKNRQSTLKQRKNRTKSQLELVDKITKKIKHENEQSIEKMIQVQKQLTHKRTQTRSSRASLNASKTMKDKTRYLKLGNSKSNQIDSQIERIEQKINNAKNISRHFHHQIAEKAKSYSKNFEQIMDKIKAEQLKDQHKCFQDYYHRATHILQCSQKSKSFYQKQSQRKKRNISQKFSRANQNLKELDKKRQYKLEQLQTKFNKSFAPKTWRSEKNELYLSKFLKNQRVIEHQKSLKAESILKKHLNISLKNMALKEKKDRILQTVKKIQF